MNPFEPWASYLRECCEAILVFAAVDEIEITVALILGQNTEWGYSAQKVRNELNKRGYDLDLDDTKRLLHKMWKGQKIRHSPANGGSVRRWLVLHGGHGWTYNDAVQAFGGILPEFFREKIDA